MGWNQNIDKSRPLINITGLCFCCKAVSGSLVHMPLWSCRYVHMPLWSICPYGPADMSICPHGPADMSICPYGPYALMVLQICPYALMVLQICPYALMVRMPLWSICPYGPADGDSRCRAQGGHSGCNEGTSIQACRSWDPACSHPRGLVSML